MSDITTIYLITGIIGIAIAFLLVYLADLSARAKMVADRKLKNEEEMAVSLPTDDSIKKTIYKELDGLVGSGERQDAITEVISSVFTKELGQRVDSHVKKLSEKYEGIIKDKTQSEELAWKKYKKIIIDKEETEAVIRNIAEGLVVVDAKGRIVMMNPAAEKLLDVSKKDKIGKSILDDIKEEQLFSLAKNSQDEERKEVELVSKRDDTRKILRASTAVIENENGQTVGMVSVLSDITKQKELDQMKSNFVASVSHELRTPIVAIGKSIALILNNTAGQISDTQNELLSIADRNLKRLNFLINDLLDLSSLEAGKLKIRREYVSVDSIITAAVEGLMSWANTKSIRLEKDIEKGLPDVYVDSNRMIQVLNNLIGNSIKFTPKEGAVTVIAKLPKGSPEIEVRVRDNGIGISREELSKVFDKFYQTGERVATDITGTGIGLSITKEIVELHGGRVWAESEKGKGADFIFTIPLKSGG